MKWDCNEFAGLIDTGFGLVEDESGEDDSAYLNHLKESLVLSRAYERARDVFRVLDNNSLHLIGPLPREAVDELTDAAVRCDTALREFAAYMFRAGCLVAGKESKALPKAFDLEQAGERHGWVLRLPPRGSGRLWRGRQHLRCGGLDRGRLLSHLVLDWSSTP